MKFATLRLSEPLLSAVASAGYETATPIQSQAIPPALEGRDILGCAQTGTGKTAAFALPILERLAATPSKRHRPVRSLIVTPTRELAAQIGESLRTYGRNLRLTSAVIFGGVGAQPQVNALRRGVDILVATPGRLLDLANQGHVELGEVEVLVLDEADRMLDMGFINDIRRILRMVPTERQTLFFSATMPAEIRGLADSMLIDPVAVAITPQATTAESVSQRVYLVERDDKQALLAHLLVGRDMTKTLVFTRTKHGADRVAKKLARAGIEAVVIHGNKSQNARTRALASFQNGRAPVLVASDIAARGLDIDDVSHVVNFDLPNEPETYVHRIGRTGRGGASGAAISFCSADELEYLRDIEKITSRAVPVEDEHPFRARFEKLPARSSAAPSGTRSGRPRRASRGRNSSGGRGTGGQRPPRPAGERSTRPGGERSARPGGERSARPAGERSPRPGGERSARPAGERSTRPAGERSTNGSSRRESTPRDARSASDDRGPRSRGDRPSEAPERPRRTRAPASSSGASAGRNLNTSSDRSGAQEKRPAGREPATRPPRQPSVRNSRGGQGRR